MKKNVQLLLAGASMFLLFSCNQPMNNEAGKPDHAAEMKSRYNIVNDAFSTGNTAGIDTLVAADVIDHAEDTSMHLPPGPEGLKQMIAMMRAESPDLKSEVKFMAADGDMLIAYGTMSGTNTGPLMGSMPPTNKAWSCEFCDVVKFNSDMKMAEHWGVWDQMKVMKDLGMMPPMDQASGNKPQASGKKK